MQGKESMLRKNDYRYRSDTSRFVIFLYLLDKRHAIIGEEGGEKKEDRNSATWINARRCYSCCSCRVDDLYRFIHAWVPSLYGELDENYWRERGYILLDTDTDLSPELSGVHEAGKAGEGATEEGKSRQDSDEISELTRESWEVSVLLLLLSIYFLYIFIFEIVPLRKFSSDHQQFFLYVGTLNSIYSSTNDFHDWESYVKSWISNEIFLSMEKKKVVGRKI